MANQALYEEWISSVHRLRQAQRPAGIEEALAALSGRNANAYAKKSDAYASDYRRAVFSIPNEGPRLRVIREDRENYRIYKAYRESELGGKRAEVRSDGAAIRREHLAIAAGFGACVVLMAAELWGSVGALLGAVIAILMAAVHIRRAAAEAEEARHAISEQEARPEQLGGDDGTFSETEAESGFPDAPGQRFPPALEAPRP